jgi:hypothetical protein
MKRVSVLGAGLVLVVGIMAADAQGVGHAPGVNPSNPQDLTNRSNPQDLLVPGGNNPQDLSNRPPGANVPSLRGPVVSPPTVGTLSPSLRYTAKIKPKPKSKQKSHRRDAATRHPRRR